MSKKDNCLHSKNVNCQINCIFQKSLVDIPLCHMHLVLYSTFPSVAQLAAAKGLTSTLNLGCQRMPSSKPRQKVPLAL